MYLSMYPTLALIYSPIYYLISFAFKKQERPVFNNFCGDGSIFVNVFHLLLYMQMQDQVLRCFWHRDEVYSLVTCHF